MKLCSLCLNLFILSQRFKEIISLFLFKNLKKLKNFLKLFCTNQKLSLIGYFTDFVVIFLQIIFKITAELIKIFFGNPLKTCNFKLEIFSRVDPKSLQKIFRFLQKLEKNGCKIFGENSNIFFSSGWYFNKIRQFFHNFLNSASNSNCNLAIKICLNDLLFNEFLIDCDLKKAFDTQKASFLQWVQKTKVFRNRKKTPSLYLMQYSKSYKDFDFLLFWQNLGKLRKHDEMISQILFNDW